MEEGREGGLAVVDEGGWVIFLFLFTLSSVLLLASPRVHVIGEG